jgi:DNA-binding SARP family transcriptional activator/tetratricopeptide (TPR) repeat protein
MEFRILGPLEVSEGGRTVPLGGAKQRALLALLLVRANEVVPADRLIDAIWDERPPETAAKALQGYVSHLRKLLGPEVILTQAPGYLLAVEPGQLDLHRFEELRRKAHQADPHEAGRLLEAALAVWRGPALADMAYESFAQPEIARLEEIRLTALEERIEADLRSGRHTDLVGELESLVAEHPLRERLSAHLLVALYRSGRQVEALEAYRRARGRLVEELGLEPGPALQGLEQKILRQDPSLDLPQPAEQRVAARGRRAAGVFVGRERELAELEAGLEDALTGRGRLFLLSGEPGIGKTRLADELGALAKDRGAAVLWGRCWEAGGAPAYWPWVQSIRSHIRDLDPSRLRRELGEGGGDLSEMLPELRELLPASPRAHSPDSEDARFRLFDSTANFLRRAAREQPLVLVLDDLHAADEPSLLLLQFVAGELAQTSILVVGCYRDEELESDHPVAARLGELGRQASARLALTGLSGAAVASFVDASTSLPAADSLVDAIYRKTEGNPLFVGEVVRLLAAEGHLEPSGKAGERLMIPRGVREVIDRRLQRLSKESRRILTLAAVLGREFPLDALNEIAELAEEELLASMDEAFATRILVEAPGGDGRARFSHALIRDTLYDELSPTRRARLHLRIGETLERYYEHDLEPHLAELAYHFIEAGTSGEIRRAVDYTLRAGDRAARLLAYEEAARLYRLALRANAKRQPPDEISGCQLLLALGDAQARAGDISSAKKTFLQAAATARRSQAPEQLARAALGYGGRFLWDVGRGDVHLVPLLEEALTALGEVDSPLRVRLLTRLAAGPLRNTDNRELRLRLGEEAMAIARRLGDPATLVFALEGVGIARWTPAEMEEHLATADELFQLARTIGDNERIFAAIYFRAPVLLELGDMRGAQAELEQAERLAKALKQPAQNWFLVAQWANFRLLEGRFEEAERLISEALALGARAEQHTFVTHAMQMYMLRREQGRIDELDDIVGDPRVADHRDTYPVWRCLLAHHAAELGEVERANELFEDLAADEFDHVPVNEEWLLAMTFLADVAGFLGDRERGATLYRLLLPYADHVAVGAPELSTGSVSRGLGALATMLSRWEKAERHFEGALALNAKIGARPWVARTQHEYARMLLARRRPADREKAEDLLADSRATARTLGMNGLEAKLEGLRTPLPG